MKTIATKVEMSLGRLLGALTVVGLIGGCATAEKEVQSAAKDWCMTVRGSQVVPVYPLTEDIQPGDIYLVQVPVDKQQTIYKKKGFLPLDNHLARMNPGGYLDFYDHSFMTREQTNFFLPRDWIRPNGVGAYRGTNGTNTASWQAAPRAAFPSYSFSVRNGAGLNLAVPVQGVPVGLSLLASDAATGSLQISDARTLGVDTLSLYLQLRDWAATNPDFLRFFGRGTDDGNPNYLRVVTRVFACGRMSVLLKDASNRSAGLDFGTPKPVNLLIPEVSGTNHATPEETLKNYTNATSVLSEMVKAASTVASNASGILPGGSLRLTAASSRSVGLDETFDPPVVFGYLGFDCAVFKGGVLGPPIPTFAVLDPSYNLGALLKSSPVNGQMLDKALYGILAADPASSRARAARQKLDALASYVPNEFIEYSGGGTNGLTATRLGGDVLHSTNFPAYYSFHSFRAVLDESISALQQSLQQSSFPFKNQNGETTTVAQSSQRQDLENALAYYQGLRQRMSDDPSVQRAYDEAYGYFLEKLIR